MKKPSATAQSRPSKASILGSAKGKLAILALSALSAGGCKVCLSWSSENPEAFEKYKTQESTREAAVDDNGHRSIHLRIS